MSSARLIGAWASGKRHLGAALDALVQHEFRAAQIWITSPGRPELIEIEDVARLRELAREEIRVFVHAPYTTLLFPPLVKHGKQMAWMAKLGAAVDAIDASLILHMGRHKVEYLDTAIAAAAQMLSVIPPTVPVLIENDTHGQIETLVRLVAQLRATFPKLGVCLDTAHAWAAGQEYLFAEDPHGMLTFHKRCGAVIGLLHLNNTTAAFGSEATADHFPLFNGQITVEQFQALLRALPYVPVVLERQNFVQAMVDRAAVIAMDSNLIETLEAMRKSPIYGALSS